MSFGSHSFALKSKWTSRMCGGTLCHNRLNATCCAPFKEDITSAGGLSSGMSASSSS
ncbi:unnamed protein product [Ectocarpus sp. CCAP 1310/34]|nr:unnamed protein product [Ectocarpus sp. CCAP 1310/34]